MVYVFVVKMVLIYKEDYALREFEVVYNIEETNAHSVKMATDLIEINAS